MVPVTEHVLLGGIVLSQIAIRTHAIMGSR